MPTLKSDFKTNAAYRRIALLILKKDIENNDKEGLIKGWKCLITNDRYFHADHRLLKMQKITKN